MTASYHRPIGKPVLPAVPRTATNLLPPPVRPAAARSLTRVRLVLRGNPDHLRALRAAEMAAWEATGGDVLHSSQEFSAAE